VRDSAEGFWRGFSCVLLPRRRRKRNSAVSIEMPKSHNPLSAYSPSEVPAPQLTNSPLLTQLIRDGKLYLSLKDAIRLALENNLDLAIARYNLPIALTDILRTKLAELFAGEHRRGAGNSGRRSGRLRGWSSGGGRRRHDWGRGRRWRGCFRTSAVDFGRRHSSPIL